MSPVRRSATRRRGSTLAEVLVAAAISVVVILAIGQIDVTRVYLSREAGVKTSSEAGVALAHMVKFLKQADRVDLVNASHVKFRVPQQPTNLDSPASYAWFQYRFNGPTNEILFCTGSSVTNRFTDIDGLTIQYQDESPAPPGGEPPVQDNNILELAVDPRWSTEPAVPSTVLYTSQVTIRGGAYTNIMTGLAPSGVSNPPGTC